MKRLRSLFNFRPALRWGIIPVIAALGLFLVEGQTVVVRTPGKEFVAVAGTDTQGSSGTVLCDTRHEE